MKSLKSILIGLLIGSVSFFVFADVITEESNTFTFPPITAVNTKKYSKQMGYFKASSINLRGGNIAFSWYVPESFVEENEGEIIIYSLLGRVVKKIPIYRSKGTVEWNLKDTGYRNGMYIVNFRYEDFNRNLKLMLWK